MQTICSSCGKTLVASEVLYTADALIVCAPCHGKADLTAPARTSPWAGVVGMGLLAGVAPFVLSISSSSYREVDGVVHATYRDWIAIGGGAVAILCGLAAIAGALRGGRSRRRLALGAVVLALGGFQLARGFGVFESAPSGTRPPGPAPAEPIMAKAAPAVTRDPASCATQDACDKLAEELAKTDPGGAVTAQMRSCDLGQKYSCVAAARAWEDGVAGTADPKRALGLLQRACDLGNAVGCTDAGVAYLTGEIVAKDLDRGRTLTEKGCEGGSAVGCKNLAAIYQDGLGVPVDLAKSFELAARTCDSGSLDSSVINSIAEVCNATGTRLLEGRGTKPDPARALRYYARACEHAPRYCYNLGVASAEGLGGAPKDPKSARTLYTKACDAGSLEACNNLGDLLNRGRGGAKDVKGAKQLFAKACDGGMDMACKNLGKK